MSGSPNWADYRVDATVTIHDDRAGQAGIAARVQSEHYYYELLLGRDEKGAKSWLIRVQRRHKWTTIASGPFEYVYGTPYRLRFVLEGAHLQAWIGPADGQLAQLGEGSDPNPNLTLGQIGLVNYGATARFDDVAVSGGVGIEACSRRE